MYTPCRLKQEENRGHMGVFSQGCLTAGTCWQQLTSCYSAASAGSSRERKHSSLCGSLSHHSKHLWFWWIKRVSSLGVAGFGFKGSHLSECSGSQLGATACGNAAAQQSHCSQHHLQGTLNHTVPGGCGQLSLGKKQNPFPLRKNA